MNIIDITTLNTHILALTETGTLLSWNLAPSRLEQENIRDFPYLANQIQYQVLEKGGVGVLRGQREVFFVGGNQVRVVGVGDVEGFLVKGREGDGLLGKCFREEHGIQTAILLNLPQQSSMLDQSKQNNPLTNNPEPEQHQTTLLYTTKTGKILSLTPSSASPTQICDIAQSPSQSHSWHECVTSLIPYREGTLLLAGTSAGRVLIVSLVLGRVVQDVTGRNGVKLGAVRGMGLSGGGHRFYSVHDGCVVQWSMELQKCLGYFSYLSPYSMLQTQKVSFDSPKILISGGSRLIEVIDSNNPQQRAQIETNLDSIHIMKQLNGKIFCGGRHGMIEIIQMGIPYLILFKNDPDLIF